MQDLFGLASKLLSPMIKLSINCQLKGLFCCCFCCKSQHFVLELYSRKFHLKYEKMPIRTDPKQMLFQNCVILYNTKLTFQPVSRGLVLISKLIFEKHFHA